MESPEFNDGSEHELSEEELLDEGSISAEEEGFLKGYSDEGNIPTCDECGVAIRDKKVSKTLDGEKHRFCSEECSLDFEESMN